MTPAQEAAYRIARMGAGEALAAGRRMLALVKAHGTPEGVKLEAAVLKEVERLTGSKSGT